MAYKDPLDPRNRAARRKHYRNNREQYYERNAKAKAAKRAWLIEQKAKPCMDCGVRYPSYVMDFDHRDPSLKRAGVAVLTAYSWKALKTEVAKCDLVCSNCHRERTYGVEAEVAGRSPKPPTTAFDSLQPRK